MHLDEEGSGNPSATLRPAEAQNCPEWNFPSPHHRFLLLLLFAFLVLCLCVCACVCVYVSITSADILSKRISSMTFFCCYRVNQKSYKFCMPITGRTFIILYTAISKRNHIQVLHFRDRLLNSFARRLIATPCGKYCFALSSPLSGGHRRARGPRIARVQYAYCLKSCYLGISLCRHAASYCLGRLNLGHS